ncbi:MAG: dynamin family protein [Pseudomonadota bacterium]
MTHPPAYGDLRSELLSLIDELAENLPGALRPALALRDKLQAGQFDVLTVGQFKRGKTSLINALLGESLLPTAAVPLTSVVTILTYGETHRVTVRPLDGGPFDIPPDALADYVTEPGNPGNGKGVREVLIRTPSPLLRNGVRIVDTPGVGSVFRHNTDTAYAWLPQCDAALFVLSADQPASEAELEFLHEVRKYAGRIFFLLNKIDILREADTAEIERFSRRVLAEALGADVRIFPVSAAQALMGKAANDPARLEASRLAVFAEALERFLMEEKGAMLLDAAASGLARLIARMRLETELERNSLALPIAELDENIARFAARRAQAERELGRLDGRLRQEFRLLSDGLFKGDIERRLGELRSSLGRRFDGRVLAQDHQTPKDFDENLETFVREEVAEAFSGWREAVEKQGAAAVAEIAEEFNLGIDQTIADLQGFASGLFRLAVPAAAPETRWPEKPHAGFRPAGEPVGLELLAEQALKRAPDLVAPRFRRLKTLAERWARHGIVRRRRRQLAEAVEMLAGRIRSDFRRRLDAAREELSASLRRRLENVADGLEQALARGAAERSQASGEAGPRLQRLEAQLALLDGLDERIQAFRSRAAAQART